MGSHDYTGAITAYEAALALDVNDESLTSSYRSGSESARASLSAALEAARAHLADGESAVAGKDWETGIECFSAGLSIDGMRVNCDKLWKSRHAQNWQGIILTLRPFLLSN